MPGLTFRIDQNAQNNATTVDLTEPAGLAVGDFVLLPAVWKRTDATLATPSNWSATTEHTLGTGTAGAGAGQMKAKAFYRTIDSTTLPTLTMAGNSTGRQLNIGSIVWIPDAGWIVEVTSSAGSDTTATTDFSVTGSTVLPFVEDDWMVLTAALTNVTPTFAAEGQTISIAGATFDAFVGRWESAPTTGDDLRHHCYTARCTAGLATAAPSFTVTTSAAAGSTGGMVFYRLHPVHLPWHILDIDGTGGGNHFKLQYAPDGGGAVQEKTRAEITAGFYLSPYFYPVGDDQEWCRFQVRLDSATTGGTSYARSELREMQTDGTTQAAWSTASDSHRLKATIRVPSLAFDKPTIIFGQIHDGTSDALQVCTELNATSGLVEGRLRINGTSSGRPKLELDFKELEEHTYYVDVTAGVTRVYWDDLNNPIHITSDISSATAYFKAGCYPNTDETTDPPGTDYAMVDVKNLSMWHTGFAGSELLPGGPAPADSLFLAA